MELDLSALTTAIIQLGFAVSALRLARQLKVRVEDHEVRIRVVEKQT